MQGSDSGQRQALGTIPFWSSMKPFRPLERLSAWWCRVLSSNLLSLGKSVELKQKWLLNDSIHIIGRDFTEQRAGLFIIAVVVTNHFEARKVNKIFINVLGFETNDGSALQIVEFNVGHVQSWNRTVCILNRWIWRSALKQIERIWTRTGPPLNQTESCRRLRWRRWRWLYEPMYAAINLL